jgi:hypothetical protein
MTPTPEERAKDVVALLMKQLPGTQISIVMADRDEAFTLISQAIREAEDAAYDRAAAEFASDPPHWRGPREIQATIRSLKSPKEV